MRIIFVLMFLSMWAQADIPAKKPDAGIRPINTEIFSPIEKLNFRRLIRSNDTNLFAHMHTLGYSNFSNCKLTFEVEGGKGLKLRLQTSVPTPMDVEIPFPLGTSVVSAPGDLLRESDGNTYQYMLSLVTVAATEASPLKLETYFLKYKLMFEEAGLLEVSARKWTTVGNQTTQDYIILCGLNP